MGRSLWFAAAATLLTACGGGTGGGGASEGPTDWGVPFVPVAGTRTMTVLLRNLDTGSATATLQGFEPDGTPYAGPVTVQLDGNDEHALDVSTALAGDTPAGGWIEVHTPSRLVEVAFDEADLGKDADEASRAWPLGDLAAPPPTTFAGITVTPETSRIQLSNATGAPIVVAVTAYQESALFPLDPPVASTPAPIALAAHETKVLTPDAIAGITAFLGSFAFSSGSPFLAAAEEDLAYSGCPQVEIEPRILTVSLDFGPQTAIPATYTDFKMVVRNDDDSANTVSIDRIALPDGTLLLGAARTVELAAHESRVIHTSEPPFDDILGDALAASFLQHVWIQLSVPQGVDVTFRQFDPVLLSNNMTVVPHPAGHVIETLDVVPDPLALDTVQTTFTLINPFARDVDVALEALVPQPDGFDTGAQPLVTLTVPAGGTVDYSPDGTVYFDRDGVPATLVGFRMRSSAPFAVAGRREHVLLAGIVTRLSPVIFRIVDETE